MFQLLMAESDRGWRTLNTDPARTQAVTAADVQRVAKQYFESANRNVLIFYTGKTGPPGPRPGPGRPATEGGTE